MLKVCHITIYKILYQILKEKFINLGDKKEGK